MMCGSVLTIEVMITFMPGLRWSKRRGRRTRKIRRALSLPKAGTTSTRRARREMMTIVKSRQFQPSLRYALGVNAKPRAMILSTISMTKAVVRYSLIVVSWSLRVLASSRGTSMARQIEDTMIRRMITASKAGWMITAWHAFRRQLSGPMMLREIPSRPPCSRRSSTSDARPASLAAAAAAASAFIALISSFSSSSSSSSCPKASRRMAMKRFMMTKKPTRIAGTNHAKAITSPWSSATTSKQSYHVPVKTPNVVSIASKK
mmetsp:Transcript_12687/g.25586  ORF Transcript_12687/g.25586 Transcript_12687/m.25586 type:complete len:261 (-) Transcript_12687:655-1437(-)